MGVREGRERWPGPLGLRAAGCPRRRRPPRCAALSVSDRSLWRDSPCPRASGTDAAVMGRVACFRVEQTTGLDGVQSDADATGPRFAGRDPQSGGGFAMDHTTNNAGVPVESDEHSLTVSPDGPVLLQDHYLIEKMAQFNRERVPERVVHAKGGGAFGELVITHDVSKYTKAAFLQPGKKTESLVRFSTVAGEQGSPDTWRDPRGFAMKFYTEEGNYDLVGNNTPVFFIKDAIKFPDFIRSQKRLPGSGLRDHDMQWDFWTLRPETAHQVTWLMGDRGIPKTWRNMDGFGSHTYQWVNAAGERFWVKYHFKTDQGIEFLTQAEADSLAGSDPDYHRADLYNAIERGEFPS